MWAVSSKPPPKDYYKGDSNKCLAILLCYLFFYPISEVNTTSCERVPQDDLDSSLPSLIPNYFGAWRRSAPYTIAEFFSDHFYNSKLLGKPFVLIESEEA